MSYKFVFIAAVLLLLSSCYTTCIVPNGSSQAHDVKVLTTYSYMWGLKPDTRLRQGACMECDSSGLSRVTVVTNFGDILCAVVTLGMVMPTRIWYDCATPKVCPPAPPCPGEPVKRTDLPIGPAEQKKAVLKCPRPNKWQSKHDKCK